MVSRHAGRARRGAAKVEVLWCRPEIAGLDVEKGNSIPVSTKGNEGAMDGLEFSRRDDWSTG